MEIKDAAGKAIAFATESLGHDRTKGIRLEEVESSSVDGRPVWLITLSSASLPKDQAIRELLGIGGIGAGRKKWEGV